MTVRTALLAIPLALAAGAAAAAPCGNDASGFERWKATFAPEAAAAGVGQRGLQALAGARYSTRTIAADRNQTGVRYALDDFIRIRLGSLDGFAAQARIRRDQQRRLLRGDRARLRRAAGHPPRDPRDGDGIRPEHGLGERGLLHRDRCL